MGPAPRGARLVARGWGYRYPGRARPALAGVDLEVGAGELVVLMGASGSGKSTLLAALAGTLPGEGATGSLDVVPSGGPEGPGGARIGLVQQEPEANIVMERVGDDVAFPLECAAVPWGRIWPLVADALRTVGPGVAATDSPTATLSGGQQQLLALAAATVAEPDLLLLDEPTANLDPGSAAEVVEAVARVRSRSGATVVVVEHRVEPWLAAADRVLLAADTCVQVLAAADLGEVLGRQPGLAARVWLDHARLPDRRARSSAGGAVLHASALQVAGRLPATDVVVHSAEVVALTGPPGSGKSTLLACAAGLLEPSSGRVAVRVDGAERTDPWRWPARDVARTFGVVFQNPEHQFVTGRVIDELQHGLLAAGVPAGQARARSEQMLERLHLSDLAQADPFTLSGGEQRRLSVGTALVLDPGILVLDEPTFGQDPATWAEVVDIIAGHRDAGGAVLLATHDHDLVEALGAREIGMRVQGVDSTSAAGRPRDQPARTDAPAPAAIPTGGAARLRRLDPLALLTAAMLLSLGALASASVALNLALAAGALVAAVAGGVPRRRMLLLGAPAAVAAGSVALSNALLSSAGITSAVAWQAAALPASRILAVALPGLVAAVALDPTALADSLVGRLRVPARAAYSALAGLRLLPLLADEWTTLGRASRARGLAGSGVRHRAAAFAATTFRLLVAALRRAGRLAVALDVRGLRSDTPRTVARPLRWGVPDTAVVLVGGSVLVAGIATRL